jgi:hypothetical protein
MDEEDLEGGGTTHGLTHLGLALERSEVIFNGKV